MTIATKSVRGTFYQALTRQENYHQCASVYQVATQLQAAESVTKTCLKVWICPPGIKRGPCVCMCVPHLTLCNAMDCNPLGSSVCGISQARILEQVCHFLLQGIFPAQGWNLCFLCLLHWQAVYLPVHHLGRPPKKNLYIW